MRKVKPHQIEQVKRQLFNITESIKNALVVSKLGGMPVPNTIHMGVALFPSRLTGTFYSERFKKSNITNLNSNRIDKSIFNDYKLVYAGIQDNLPAGAYVWVAK